MTSGATLAYRPTSGGRPASWAYARLCGISINVTMAAASASRSKVSRSYWRAQCRTGRSGHQRRAAGFRAVVMVVSALAVGGRQAAQVEARSGGGFDHLGPGAPGALGHRPQRGAARAAAAVGQHRAVGLGKRFAE